MAEVREFGRLAGRAVESVILRGEGMELEVLTLGATIRRLVVPDREGRPTDVVLGYDTPEEYWENDGYLGASVGRCANRIGGSCFSLNGEDWPLASNEGPNQLHGGPDGFSRRWWSVAASETEATFTLDSPHLDQGFPGDLHEEVTYALRPGSRLEITYRARCDRDTVANFTNHAYFNLSGHGSGPATDHTLQVLAGRYTPAGAGSIPTGEILPVAGTPLDFAVPVAIGSRISDPFLAGTQGYDHNFVLDRGEAKQGELVPAAKLCSPRTGILLTAETTLEGVQVYTANFLSPRKGKGGAVYGPYHGVCLETQHFPDAIHHPNFPSPVLRAGEALCERTVYAFSVCP